MKKAWDRLNWRQRERKRKADAKKLIEELKVCHDYRECTYTALKVAMMRMAYPKDCPDPLELIAAQLATSPNAEDLKFLLKYFPTLLIRDEVERQLGVLESEHCDVPEELKKRAKK